MKKISFVVATLTMLPAGVFGKSALVKIDQIKNKIERAVDSNQTRPFKELLKRAQEEQKKGNGAETILRSPLIIVNDAKVTETENTISQIENKVNELYWCRNAAGLKNLQTAIGVSKEVAQIELHEQIVEKYGTTKSSLLVFATDLSKEESVLKESTDSIVKALSDTKIKNNTNLKNQIQKLFDQITEFKNRLNTYSETAGKILTF